MASIGPVNLQIRIEGANARVTIRYNVCFSDFDRRTNLRYNEVCKIYGDDTGVGDFLAGGDDSIPRGTLLATTIRSNGATCITRNLEKLFSRHELDEDIWFNNPDDIRARVNLTPVFPRTAQRVSNLVRMNF